MRTHWIVCKDYEDKYHVIQVHGRETAKLFLVTEKDNPNGAHWRLIKSCLHYRTRLDKDDRRLHPTRESAIKAQIGVLEESKRTMLRKIAATEASIAELQGLL